MLSCQDWIEAQQPSDSTDATEEPQRDSSYERGKERMRLHKQAIEIETLSNIIMASTAVMSAVLSRKACWHGVELLQLKDTPFVIVLNVGVVTSFELSFPLDNIRFSTNNYRQIEVNELVQ